MKSLRLILLEECYRSCNNQFDFSTYPTIKNFSGYNEVILTGGEPMLKPNLVIEVAKKFLKEDVRTKIYLYTAKVDNLHDMHAVLHYLDGVTITLHKQNDVLPFMFFAQQYRFLCETYSMRLNIFKDIKVPEEFLEGWQVKDNIEWIDNCPVPEDELMTFF